MKVALIDNGSLEPAAHRNLRAVAAALGDATRIPVAAVSWKHSDRIPAAELDGNPAWTIGPWLRRELATGEREFVFVPFFVSAQGAIGSALRRDLEELAAAGEPFTFRFTEGLAAAGALAPIVAARINETMAAHGLRRPLVVVVDHGGPSPASAALRDRVAADVRSLLGAATGPVVAASMESPTGPEFAFNRPLLEELLVTPDFAGGDVVIAPLFLSPGRHAGPAGDLAQIAAAARAYVPAQRCHFSGLIGNHPRAVQALAAALAAHVSVPASP